MDKPKEIAASDVWLKVINSLQNELTPHVYERWLKPLEPLRITEYELTLGVPDEFFKSWVCDHYGHMILLVLKDVTGQPDFKLSFNSENSFTFRERHARFVHRRLKSE